MTISKKDYADYMRLKQLEHEGHLLSVNALRMIVRACDYDPEKVGKHFLEVYARWKRRKLK